LGYVVSRLLTLRFLQLSTAVRMLDALPNIPDGMARAERVLLFITSDGAK